MSHRDPDTVDSAIHLNVDSVDGIVVNSADARSLLITQGSVAAPVAFALNQPEPRA